MEYEEYERITLKYFPFVSELFDVYKKQLKDGEVTMDDIVNDVNARIEYGKTELDEKEMEVVSDIMKEGVEFMKNEGNIFATHDVAPKAVATRSARTKVIQKDEIVNLTIALNTSEDVLDFIERM